MSDEILGFKITGKAIKTVLNQLRPAFPKKGEWSRTVATITVRTNHVTFGLPGAAVGTDAIAAKNFRVELPFSELKFLRDEPFKPDAEIAFGFEPKRMFIGAISIGHERIHVLETGDCLPAVPSNAALPADPQAVQPMDEAQDGFVGYPLLGIYETLRKYPPNTFSGNARLKAGEAEIEKIMTKLDKLLKPLGIGRNDILDLIDKRIGSKK